MHWKASSLSSSITSCSSTSTAHNHYTNIRLSTSLPPSIQVGAERFRQKALLRTSFRGLLAETKKTAVDRALDEESSNRRARIAALMSTLTVAEKEEEGSTSAPTRAESKATPDRASSSRTSARRETKHMGIVQVGLSLSLRLQGLFLCTVGILFHTKWCISQLWCFSIIL